MSNIVFDKKSYMVKSDESVLDTLLANDIDIAYDCKRGICQTCIMQATSGSPPPQSQEGLKDTQAEQGYFLSCICKPSEDLEISIPNSTETEILARIIEAKRLSANIYRIWLSHEDEFDYKAGQFIHLRRLEDNLTRSYSIASVKGIDGIGIIELHIKVYPDGNMSEWLTTIACTNNSIVSIKGPMGNCFYSSKFVNRPIILLGYSTGLAPLYGVLRDALNQGHQKPISLFHWGSDNSDHYYEHEIKEIAKLNNNLLYCKGLESKGLESTDENLNNDSTIHGDATEHIIKTTPNLAEHIIYLCGSENKVNQARKKLYLAGANLKDIYADAFITWQQAQVKTA